MRLTIKWDYFLDAWNILDWFNLIMMIITVCYKIDTWAKAGALYVISPADWNAVTRDMYSNFHGVSSNIRQVHSLVAFNTILTWFKAVKYINIIPYVTTFMQTVSISQVNLGSWIVVFCCTLTGFVLAFSTAFGADVSALRTPFQARIKKGCIGAIAVRYDHGRQKPLQNSSKQPCIKQYFIHNSSPLTSDLLYCVWMFGCGQSAMPD